MSDRKRLLAAFRERKVPRGVLGIRNLTTGRVFLDHAPDLEARWNRHRFQLDFGNHPCAALQADWKTLGAEAFCFQVLAELAPQDPPQDDREDLAALEGLVAQEALSVGGLLYEK